MARAPRARPPGQPATLGVGGGGRKGLTLVVYTFLDTSAQVRYPRPVNPPDQALSAPSAPVVPAPAAHERTRSASPAPAAPAVAAATTSPARPATVGLGVPDATPAPPWYERIRDRLNSLVATDEFQRWSARFPLTRPITMQRSRAVFDIVSGFVYTQTLLACVELELFEYLAGGARTIDEISRHTRLSPSSTERLLNAAASLRLLVKRRHGRYALGPLGAPLVGNTGRGRAHPAPSDGVPGPADPVGLLRQGADFRTELSRYWSYADAPRPQAIDDARVAAYSEIMAATLPPVARKSSMRMTSRKPRMPARRGRRRGRVPVTGRPAAPHLQLRLFDLPAVAARARARLEQAGHGDRARCDGGNFHADSLPRGPTSARWFACCSITTTPRCCACCSGSGRRCRAAVSC